MIQGNPGDDVVVSWMRSPLELRTVLYIRAKDGTLLQKIEVSDEDIENAQDLVNEALEKIYSQNRGIEALEKARYEPIASPPAPDPTTKPVRRIRP